MVTTILKILVLAGGPDRERPVSLVSGREIAAGLRRAGHDVLMRDIGPDDLSALDEFTRWGGDAIFPALHGPWGEGGGLQRILDQRHLSYVGSRAAAAALCMDKLATKQRWAELGMPTPPWELLQPALAATLDPPVVLKPLCEGSSIDVAVCRDAAALHATRERLHARHDTLLAERCIDGPELTVGIIPADPTANATERVLPVIEIRPATGFFDYAAKYERDDTVHNYDIDLPPAVLDEVSRLALESHRRLGCRDLSRVDFMIDKQGQPWMIEVNTLPGFTPHSLVPDAAAKVGIDFAALVDRLARVAAARQRRESPAGCR